MKIAIIGGGSAGMICAHLICTEHEVTVYEKSAMLGGNIQTLNLNSPAINLAQDIITENGVTGFHYFAQATFRKLIKSLDIPIKLNLANVTSSIFLDNGLYYEIPSVYTFKNYGASYYIRKNIQLAKYWREFHKHIKK